MGECEGSGGEFDNATVMALLSNDSCHRYEPLYPAMRSCERDHFHRDRTVRCDAFLYQNTDTIYAEVRGPVPCQFVTC